jgi:hypothetical protein
MRFIQEPFTSHFLAEGLFLVSGGSRHFAMAAPKQQRKSMVHRKTTPASFEASSTIVITS